MTGGRGWGGGNTCLRLIKRELNEKESQRDFFFGGLPGFAESEVRRRDLSLTSLSSLSAASSSLWPLTLLPLALSLRST